MATWRLMGLAMVGTAAVVALLLLQGVGWAPAQAASGTVSDPNCTRNGLQAQISAAPTGGVITFNCASPLIAITQTLVITANTTLDGSNNGNPIILDGGNVTRIISLTPGVALTLTNITLQRGNAGTGGDGGAVNGGHATTVTLLNARVLTNTAGVEGGGVRVGVAVVTTTQFVSNTAGSLGGGLWAIMATVTGSSFVSNTAGSIGGGLYANSAATVMASSFVSNTAGNQGGGLRVFGAATVTVTASSFVSNTAGFDGGGFFVSGAATVTGSRFVSNTAGSSGGGLRAGGAATVTGSSFVSNTARSGGSLMTFSALSLTNSTLSANTALTSGGAISLAASSPVSVSLAYVTVVSNTAPDAAIAARVVQTGTAHGVVLQQGATGANCLRVTFPGATGLVATDTSCGNPGATLPSGINLGPLADNGGPSLPDGAAMLTHAPQPGSILINGVSCLAGVPTDQRGVSRPSPAATNCDIGAVEVGGVPVYTSLTPNTALAGSPTTVVTVTGSGFIPGTVLLWNGSPRPTTFVNGTTLTATIPASDLTSATVVATTLRYGADPTSVATNSLPFTVTGRVAIVAGFRNQPLGQ